MTDRSSIEWTDATWNPVTGCTKVSEGCRNCYAERLVKRFEDRVHGLVEWYDAGEGVGGRDPAPFSKIILHPERLDQPLRWRKPRRVFVCSMSDLFHPEVPEEFIDAIWSIMALRPKHTFQILTKRPERMQEYVFRLYKQQDSAGSRTRLMNGIIYAIRATEYRSGLDLFIAADAVDRSPIPLRNVWLGVSCENQKAADERIPHLLQTPAAVRFVSAEPLLGPVDFTAHCPPDYAPHLRTDRIGWVIVGGESGPGARSCNVEWIRSIVGQCREAEVSCFVKQLGANVTTDFATWESWSPAPKIDGGFISGNRYRAFLQSRKGADPAEWPKDLRVRETPNPTTPA